MTRTESGGRARTPSARIIVAEPWAVLRRGLVDVLHGPHVVVADIARSVDVRALLRERPCDVVVVGFARGVDVGVAVADLVAAGSAQVMVLADDVAADALRAMLRSGAAAVLSARIDDDELLDAVARVMRGDRVVDQCYLPLLFGDLDAIPGRDDDSLLTPRERQVLEHLARGASNREIAASLIVGESTVKTHLGRIYTKLEVDSRHHAVGRALELGLLG